MLSRKCIDDTSEMGLSPFTPQVNDWIWSTAAHVIRDEQAQFQTEKKRASSSQATENELHLTDWRMISKVQTEMVGSQVDTNLLFNYCVDFVKINRSKNDRLTGGKGGKTLLFSECRAVPWRSWK